MLAAFFLSSIADAHAVLVNPPARVGQATPVGKKLTPFEDWPIVFDNPGPDCGGTKGNPGADPGPIMATFVAGQEIDVSWLMTIEHPSDRLDYGVRIALHYGPGDSYAENVLADKEDAGVGDNQLITKRVKIPEGKTSNNAVLKWMWAARADGGFYLGCSDVRIIGGIGGAADSGKGPANPSLLPPPVPRGGAGENGSQNPLGGSRPSGNDNGVLRDTGMTPTTNTRSTYSDTDSDNTMYYLAGAAMLLVVIVFLYYRNQDKKAEETASSNAFQQMPREEAAVQPPSADFVPMSTVGVPPPSPIQTAL